MGSRTARARPAGAGVAVTLLLGWHLVVALACVAAGRRLGRATFLLAATAPAGAAVWLATVTGDVLDGRPHEATVAWAPELGLTLSFRLDGFGLLIAWLVAGVGTVVFTWAAAYFGDRTDTARLAATLVVFAGSMLGLVAVDDVYGLFVFWELTTVTSYLLIGIEDRDGAARAAALRALLVTGAGGLALLGGLVVLATEAGTTSLHAILTDPPTGTTVGVAVALVVVGALTKSAQWPFSFWLPGAMAAPTPISAYLHSATMVKAGVYLLARFSPAFASLGWWRPVVVGLGLVTMLVGGWRALRQHDVKLLLAQGTVSQLGFMVVLVGAGHDGAALAGAAVILAHGLFKSALFLVVGIVDHQAHTRDLRRLGGLGRRLPAVAAVAVVAGASMAGIPPLLGFVAKELAYTELLEAGGAWTAVLVGVVAGSVLTFAYTARFLWGTFADRADGVAVDAEPAPPALVAPAALLAVATVVAGVAPQLVDPLVTGAAQALAPGDGVGHLALWHGLNAALGLSFATIALGVLAFLARERIARVAARVPHPQLGERAYAAALRDLNRAAESVTGIVQSGSLPVYLAVLFLTLVLVPLPALLGDAEWPDVVLAESPLQVAIVAVMLTGAAMVARARRRITAALCLGVVGAGMAGLFVVQGAPDLAATQLLVEVLSLVLFVLVLRLLPARFHPAGPRGSQVARAAVGVVVATGVLAFALATAGARRAPSVSEQHLDLALPEGEGANVVNVTLVDIRGWDTLGEITVLVVAAVGIAGLIVAGRRDARREPS